MNKLWRYEDYAALLSHENALVRKWAFRGINSRYKRQYTDGVAALIHDADELLASMALQYLSDHQAIQHAPAILELLRTSEGMVASNCADALAEMGYEPALEAMLEKLEATERLETTMGTLEYLGRKRGEKSRLALIAAVEELEEGLSLDAAVSGLLNHYIPEDISLIMQRGLDLPDVGAFSGSFSRSVLDSMGASPYFSQLMDYGENRIVSKPAKTIEDLFSSNTQIPLDPAFKNEVVGLLEKRQYREVTNHILQSVQKTVANRYSGQRDNAWLEELLGKDDMCVHLLEYLSQGEAVWNRLEKRKSEREEFISFVVSIYFAVMEREAYIEALHPEAETETLLSALQNSGPGIPKDILRRIEAIAPVGQLKEMLSKELTTWADISVVRLMGRIGDPGFVPDLIRVIKESDSLDYIYSDGITALQALDESAEEAILEAIRRGEIDSWASFDILDHLPYAEAYDLALSLWESEGDEFMDSYELLSTSLESIGDQRGIPYLQGLWAEGVHAGYVGDALECLCALHRTDIPELTEIREQRENRKSRHWTEMDEFKDWGSDDEDEEDDYEGWEPPQIPVRRDGPKIGRNDPCPCGSGKKYKKCCLDK